MSNETKTPVQALIIRPDGTWETTAIVPLLEPMQEAIGGGWLELATVGDAAFYLDEEGKMKGLPANQAATLLAYHLGWRTDDLMVGTVLVLGPTDRQGYDTAVTENTLRGWAAVRAALAEPDGRIEEPSGE